MEIFRRREVVSFPFPYTNLTGRKLRPCLVISDEISEDIILCQITSQGIQKDNSSIELNKEETIEGKLANDSYIRANMLFTADKSFIIKKIC